MGLMIICTALLKLLSAFGLAYVIWILASKEEGNMKMIGMVISVALIVLALISVLYGTRSFGRMHRGDGSDKGITGVSATEKSNTTKVWGHKHHIPVKSVK